MFDPASGIDIDGGRVRLIDDLQVPDQRRQLNVYQRSAVHEARVTEVRPTSVNEEERRLCDLRVDHRVLCVPSLQQDDVVSHSRGFRGSEYDGGAGRCLATVALIDSRRRHVHARSFGDTRPGIVVARAGLALGVEVTATTGVRLTDWCSCVTVT